MSPARRVAAWTTAALAALAMGVASPTPAAADPSTPATYPAASSATRVSALFFDTCTAPSLTGLAAWKGRSPYAGVNIYFGGRNRACTQPNLTAAWVRSATAGGWFLVPTYMGDQPFCIFGTKTYRFTAATAAARGAADGADAVAKARALGLLPGSALYADVEHYDRAAAGCTTAVRTYVSEWTRALHRSGYLAGVYAHQDSGVRDLAASYLSTTLARPDAIWMARWDNVATTVNWPTAGNGLWAEWQRAKQYRGDHNETWGGVTMNIDSDIIRGPVATVARPYRVTSSGSLNVRSGPSSAYPIIGSLASGSTVSVICQARGQLVGTTSVWDRISTGGYVSDRYVSTPSTTTFSAPLQRCSYPGQITIGTPVNTRTGPGTTYAVNGSLQGGALAYVACQKAGTLVASTRVWNQLVGGRWVSDYYVSNMSNTTYSAPVPGCP
ncbi:glycoside hydrolase domain-containing protein [Knoellia aerolata]|uniref:Peptidoglycan-binding protein n=1 Tax=Knoellia aerolata DSM 18566 TaxID=1385519 RepID=A0A0A0JWS0_9MICO|nr:glycoside hydrolase domain-containing protein [Knoellia aerolata]KGN41663.1 peptidoglycan-binding protein [Knoellia aerolata DSM 18566]